MAGTRIEIWARDQISLTWAEFGRIPFSVGPYQTFKVFSHIVSVQSRCTTPVGGYNLILTSDFWY